MDNQINSVVERRKALSSIDIGAVGSKFFGLMMLLFGFTTAFYPSSAFVKTIDSFLPNTSIERLLISLALVVCGVLSFVLYHASHSVLLFTPLVIWVTAIFLFYLGNDTRALYHATLLIGASIVLYVLGARTWKIRR